MVQGILQLITPSSGTTKLYTLFHSKGFFDVKVESLESSSAVASNVSFSSSEATPYEATKPAKSSNSTTLKRPSFLDNKTILYSVSESGALLLHQYRFERAGTQVTCLTPQRQRCVEFYADNPRIEARAYLATWFPYTFSEDQQDKFLSGIAMLPVPKHPEFQCSACLIRRPVRSDGGELMFEYLLLNTDKGKWNAINCKRAKTDVDRVQTTFRGLNDSIQGLQEFQEIFQSKLQECFAKYLEAEECFVHVLELEAFDAHPLLKYKFEAFGEFSRTPVVDSKEDVSEKDSFLEWVREPFILSKCHKFLRRIAEQLYMFPK